MEIKEYEEAIKKLEEDIKEKKENIEYANYRMADQGHRIYEALKSKDLSEILLDKLKEDLAKALAAPKKS